MQGSLTTRSSKSCKRGRGQETESSKISKGDDRDPSIRRARLSQTLIGGPTRLAWSKIRTVHFVGAAFGSHLLRTPQTSSYNQNPPCSHLQQARTNAAARAAHLYPELSGFSTSTIVAHQRQSLCKHAGRLQTPSCLQQQWLHVHPQLLSSRVTDSFPSWRTNMAGNVTDRLLNPETLPLLTPGTAESATPARAATFYLKSLFRTVPTP